jgi:hypothetical protein
MQHTISDQFAVLENAMQSFGLAAEKIGAIAFPVGVTPGYLVQGRFGIALVSWAARVCNGMSRSCQMSKMWLYLTMNSRLGRPGEFKRSSVSL